MYKEVEVLMVRNSLSKAELAEKIGIGYNTLLDKLKRKTLFTLDECLNIKNVLNTEMPLELLFEVSNE